MIRLLALAFLTLTTPAFAYKEDDQTHAQYFSGTSPRVLQTETRRAKPHVVRHHGQHLRDLAYRTARRNNVPPHLMHGVIMVESRYNCAAFNRRGGVHGIGQVKPATARSVGIHGNLFNCETGMEAAARYLRLALNRGGYGCAGVSLYERGIYARPTCTGYGRKVMTMAANY